MAICLGFKAHRFKEYVTNTPTTQCVRCGAITPITDRDWTDIHAALEVARSEPDHNERIRLLSVVMDDLYRLTMQDVKAYIRRQPWKPLENTHG